MLYVIYGEQFEKRGKKLNELADFFMAKRPDAVLIKVTNENAGDHDLAFLAQGQGLFESKSIVVLDGLCEDKETKEKLFERVAALAASPNIFILNERSLSAADVTKFSKHAEKVQAFDAAGKTGEQFNVFAIAEALGVRDKRRAWVLLLRAFESGLEAEEIHGTVYWQLKAILAVKQAARPTVEATGLKPFALGKAKSYANNFSDAELKRMSSSLVHLYHDSHRGRADFRTGLEQFVLESL